MSAMGCCAPGFAATASAWARSTRQPGTAMLKDGPGKKKRGRVPALEDPGGGGFQGGGDLSGPDAGLGRKCSGNTLDRSTEGFDEVDQVFRHAHRAEGL